MQNFLESLIDLLIFLLQCQLVIDWLEQNASEVMDVPGLEQFTDKTIAWENTLHELQSKRMIPYKSSREFVSKLDPDAPRRLKKPLHDLDKVNVMSFLVSAKEM